METAARLFETQGLLALKKSIANAIENFGRKSDDELSVKNRKLFEGFCTSLHDFKK